MLNTVIMMLPKLWEGLKTLLLSFGIYWLGRKTQQNKQLEQEVKDAKEAQKEVNNIKSKPDSDLDDILRG